MSNQLPVYIQIHDQLKNEIEQGIWKVGDRLPSERELAVKFNVSRMTLRQAIQNLADEGILERKIGSGTYVAREKVQEKMSGATSFTEIMESQNRVPSSRTISYLLTSPSSSEMEKLNLSKDDTILRMERIRFADDVPLRTLRGDEAPRPSRQMERPVETSVCPRPQAERTIKNAKVP